VSEPTKLDPDSIDDPPTHVGENRTSDAAAADDDEVGYRLADPVPAAIPPPSPVSTSPEPRSPESTSPVSPDPVSSIPEAPHPEPHERGEPIESTFQPATDAGRPEAAFADFPDEPPTVDEVWSRWAEWKEPLLWSGGGVAMATLIVFGGPWVAIAVFLLASAYGAYHVVISLEVPVRVTPEQAVREFYEAAGHRLPNFRRMYALLTSDGRATSAFSDFADFRAYWQAQVTRLSRSPVWLVPLEFRIEGFQCRYNGDKTLAAVGYTVRVSPRGKSESSDANAEFQLRNLAVKGPDGQWYLNDGTLPETDESAR
jgi:hypothetical protein